MKKSICIVLALATLLSLTACGSSTPSEKSSASSASSTSAQAATSSEDAVVLKVAFENNPGEPIYIGAEKWSEVANQMSNGRIDVQVYGSSSLGVQADYLEQVHMGANIVAATDGGFLADYVPDVGIVSGPYLFENTDQVMTLVNSDWWAEQCQKLEDAGLYVLGSNYIYGVRQTLADKPITSPADFKGLKIRCPTGTTYTRTFEILGANPTPMALADVYTALQQGIVDGVENPLTTLWGQSFYEVAKYLSMTSHITMFTNFVTSTDFANTISDEDMEIIKESCRQGGEANNQAVEEQTATLVSQFEEQGVTVVQIDDLQPFVDTAKEFYSDSTWPEWTPNLYDTVRAAMGAN